RSKESILRVPRAVPAEQCTVSPPGGPRRTKGEGPGATQPSKGSAASAPGSRRASRRCSTG
ncbi:unnamed protein product, partial [Prorocentrum cordatum]